MCSEDTTSRRSSDTTQGRDKTDRSSSMTLEEYADECEAVGCEAPAWVLAEIGRTAPGPERTPAERAEAAGFPAVTVDAMGYLTRPMPEAVREWAAAYHGTGTPWLWLMGPTGRGKTCAAAWAVVEVMRRMDAGELARSSARFVRADKLTGLYSSARLYGEGSKTDVIEDVAGAGLLVLDDLGSEVRGAVPFEAVGLVLGERLDAMAPTVITTQYGAGEFMDRMAERKADRHDVAATLGRVCEALAGWPHGVTSEERNAAIAAHVVELGGEDMRTGAA